MSKFKFKIGEQKFEMEDLGELMNNQFLKMYISHYHGNVFSFNKFRIKSYSFFDQYVGDYHTHDKFFNNFFRIWFDLLSQKRFKDAEKLWDLALNIAYEWEDNNKSKRIHKGTPCYFYSVTCILNDNLEKGFLLMHQALEEDKETQDTNSPDTPAYYFVTLDYKELGQFFIRKVWEITRFVDKKLENYRSSRGGKLKLSDFKSKFLEEPTLQEAVFYFVFESFRLKKFLKNIDQRLTQNVFSSLLQANTIFAFCLIVDNVIKFKHKQKYPTIPENKRLFYNLLDYLSSKSSLNLHKNNRLDILNDEFINDFSNTLERLLDSRYSFQDGTKLQFIEVDLAITYGIRNFAAHRIEDQPVIYQNFDEISGRILNALFFSIEKLYI